MELDPILPSAVTPAIIDFTVRNRSDKSIEIYSLEFDPQYVSEEQILRKCKGYDEEGYIHLKVREAGEPFWEELAAEAAAAAGGAAPASPAPAAASPPKGKEPPKGKGGKETPSVVSKTEEPPVLKISTGPIMIIYGAPLSGKTTQARLLARRYKCPIVDVDDVMVTAAEKGELVLPPTPGAPSDTAPPPAVEAAPPPPPPLDPKKKGKAPEPPKGPAPIPAPSGGGFEAALQALLKTKTQEPGCINGIIFDGLNSNRVPVLGLIKIILSAVGLQASPGMLTVPASGEEPETTESRVLWKGDTEVHLIKMRFRKRRLFKRFLDLEDQEHARVRKYETKVQDEPEPLELDQPPGEKPPEIPAVENGPSCPPLPEGAGESPAEPLKESLVHGEIDPALLIPPERFKTPYPWYCAFPTPEEVDRYYTTENETLTELGGLLTPDQISALGTKLYVAVTDGMQEQKLVYEENIRSLPLPLDHETKAPAPQLYQVVKRPPLREILNDAQFPFSFLTKVAGESAPSSPKSVVSAKDAKGKPAGKGDAGKKGVPAPAAPAAQTAVSAHDTAPPGYIKQNRWVIPAKERVQLALMFWSRHIEEFEHTFKFEVLGNQGHAELEVQGICDIPRIQLRHVTFPSRKLRISPCHGVSPKHPRLLEKILNWTIEFGPVNTAPVPDGYPNIPDTEHCYRVDVENTGQFDLHVDFQLVKGEDAPSPAPSGKSAAPPAPAKKGGKPEPPKKGGAAKPAAGGGAPFILSPPSLDLKIDESADLCIYSYPAMVSALMFLEIHG